MKTNIKIILLIILGLTSITSCILDDSAPTDSYDQGSNFVGFANNERLAGVPVPEVGAIPVDFEIAFEVGGPTSMNINEDITLTLEVDETSTAVEGVNFSLLSNTVTLTPENNFSETLPITVLVDGIVAAEIEESPVAVLKISNASTSSGSILTNGREDKISFKINYLCVSDLAGMYNVTTVRNEDGSSIEREEELVAVEGEPGRYHTYSTGLWAPGAYRDDQGYDFVDVCNTITVPAQGLFAGFYTNQVYGTPDTNSSYDPETGIITVYYTITFSSGNATYTSTYVPVD